MKSSAYAITQEEEKVIAEIIALYSITDDLLKALDYREDCR